jgi:hypothetical protein
LSCPFIISTVKHAFAASARGSGNVISSIPIRPGN